MRSLIILMLGLLGSTALFFPLAALGADAGGIPDTGAIQEIEDMFRNASNQWPPIIMKYTSWLFWTLVTISWTWSFGFMALKGTDTTEIITELTRRTILIGVFWWLLQSAPQLGETIVASFSYIGDQLVGQPISANSIFDIGISLSLSILDGIAYWKGPANIGYVLVAIGIIIILALISLQMLLIVVQYFVFLNAGVVMMGFLGHEWSREYAINYFRLLLALAVKFFIMQIIVVLTMTLIDAWVKDSDLTWVQVVVLLPMLIVVYGLVQEIPAMAASMISGTDSTGGAVSGTIKGAMMMGALAMSGGGAMAAMASGGGNIGSLAYNAWKQAKGLLNAEGGSDEGSHGASTDNHDPATARLPDDNHSTASEGNDNSDSASTLPRSHQGENALNSQSQNLIGGNDEQASSPTQDRQAASANSSNAPASSPDEESPPSTTPRPATNRPNPGFGRTARLAGRIATRAIVNEGRSAFVNGLRAFAGPSTTSILGRASQSIADTTLQERD